MDLTVPVPFRKRPYSPWSSCMPLSQTNTTAHPSRAFLSLKLFIVMQCSSNQPLPSALPSFHISALHLMCWGTAWVPLFIQHCLQKDLKQLLPLILSSFFLPSCPPNNNHYKTNMQHENCWPVFWQVHWKYSQFYLWMKIVSRSSLTIAFRKRLTSHIVIHKCGFKY